MPGALSIFPLLFVIHYYAPTTTADTSVATAPSSIFPAGEVIVKRNCTAYERCTRSISARVLQDSIGYGRTANNLTSDGGAFRLGFFERGSNAYLGIWYGAAAAASPDEVIVWVANRDNPIPLERPRGYFFNISDDGNAKVFDSNNRSYWSTNHSTPSSAEQRVLQLLNTGNLVLVDGGSGGGNLWQSFENPSDTFLPGMDITFPGLALVSWKSPQDAAKGYYSFQKDNESNTLFINNASATYWDSTYSSLHPNLNSFLLNNMTGNSLVLRLVMNYTGSVELWELQEGNRGWSMIWTAPNDRCDVSDTCGIFGVCDAGNSFRCKCLPGYEPSNPGKWESEDFSSGCSTRTTDQCSQVFLPLPMVKLPPGPDIDKKGSSETVCKDLCLAVCGRRAYSFDANQSRCQIWTTDLTRIQEESIDGQTLYIRVYQSDIESGSRTCSICGTNLVPYPLSTEQNCGDPSYFSFQCNTTNGQVYFKPPSGQVYKVSLINPSSRTFFVQLATLSTSGICNAANIESKVFNLNNSTSPFNVTSCSLAPLNAKQVVVVMLSWKPPPPPTCKSSVDCTDWPNTTCGKNVCLCAKGFHWDSLFMNCTKVHHKHIPLSLGAGVAAASGIVLLLLGSLLFILRLRRRRAIQRAGIIDQFKTDDIEDIEIPFIDYQIILDVTDNFSDSNKLGAGGFGPVYKGKLPDGNEVAVKRLSRASVQGIEEFRNEVILIAKLQHRNLVRVLGYCMKEDEKILIYEYMPNKCLSSFIFDQTTSPLLDWTKRFNIILGIARGLVYLHQDSRLRIIHRDLKPSNILLDEELNPKISDFGLAKIVAGNEIATSTARVVGTYGYMSPEYALDGYFSIKSDVYSFGIILLEVISGRKCTSLLEFDNILISLLGYAWTLWDKERALELVDKSIVDSCDSFEVKRCINVGLLCVQEDPSDRPTMSTVLLMLGGGDTMSLPHPNQPVFVARRPPLETASSSSSKFGTINSNAELSTTLEGR